MSEKDELEIRVMALETANIEVWAWIPPEALDDAEASIRAHLPQAGDEYERAARLGALALIQAARERYKGYRAG